MSIALQARVTALEVEVRALREELKLVCALPVVKPDAKGPKPCPKCGEPGYHFHVVNCKGPK